MRIGELGSMGKVTPFFHKSCVQTPNIAGKLAQPLILKPKSFRSSGRTRMLKNDLSALQR